MNQDRSAELAQRITGLRRRCLEAAFVGAAVRCAALALVVAGTFTLVARIGFAVDDERAHLGWFALVLVLPYAFLRARRAVPSAGAAAAWLDERGEGSGALVTQHELGDVAEWTDAFERRAARAPRPPELRGRALLGPWPVALLFALACPFVPIASTGATAEQGVEAVFERNAERVRDKLAALEEQVDLSDEVEAQLRERLDRLERDLASTGLESGFEGLDALEQELERLAKAAVDGNAELERDLVDAAATATRSGAAANADLRESLERHRTAESRGALDEQLLSQLEALADRALSQLGDEAGLATPEQLESWVQWLDAWAKAREETRQSLLESLERLTEAGLVDGDTARAAAAALENLDDAMLEELAAKLAEALDAMELGQEEAEELREALAGLAEVPELSDELADALAELQRRIDDEFGAIETPAGPDLAGLLAEIDPSLREELFQALAEAEGRRRAAMEQALALDPEAFALDPEQVEALRRALDAMRGELARWMQEVLEGANTEALRALASSLANAAGRESTLPQAEREQLERALGDLLEATPAALADALAFVPPALRRDVLESIAEEFAAAADGRAPSDVPAATVDPAAAARMAEVLAELIAGPPATTAEALTEQDVRDAIEALRAMRPDLPGLGVP